MKNFSTNVIQRLVVITSLITTSQTTLGRVNVDSPHVEVKGIAYGGTGCPAGSVYGYISEDASNLSLLFTNLLAEAGSDVARAESRKFCQLLVDLNVSDGYQYALVRMDYSGFALLDEGTLGNVKSTYYFSGASGRQEAAFNTKVAGPYYDNFMISDRMSDDDAVWSPCGIQRALNIKVAISVEAPNESYALMGLDLLGEDDFHRHGLQKYRLAFRKCT